MIVVPVALAITTWAAALLLLALAVLLLMAWRRIERTVSARLVRGALCQATPDPRPAPDAAATPPRLPGPDGPNPEATS